MSSSSLAGYMLSRMLQWLNQDWHIDFILLCAFIAFLIATEYGIINDKKRSRVLEPRTKLKSIAEIPGPRPSLPILGTRWVFSSLGPYKLQKVHEAYKDMYLRYGDIFREETLWNFPIINVVDSLAIQKVLKQSGKYPLRPPTELTAYYRKTRPDRYTNLGLVNEQGETWHHLRASLTPVLTSVKTVTSFLPDQNTVTDDFIALLRSVRDSNNSVIKFEEFANRMGLEVTCSLMLGRRMGFLSEQIDPIAAKLATAVKVHFCASRDTFYGLPFWKSFPTKTYSSFVESEETIYEIISDLVEQALVDEANTCSTGGVQSVFMSILQAEGLDIRDKKAAIIDFIAAGIQTLGNTLVFLLYLISKRPDVQEKLREELSEVVTTDGDITHNAIKKSCYLRACILEAFRVLPTAPCVARILEKDLEIGGFNLNAGTVMLCHTWIACLEDSNFSKAAEFRPERWLEDGGKLRNSFLVIPFGCGKRMCPGKRFIEQELHIVLAKMVTEFHLEFDGDLDLQFEFLLAPKGPVSMRLIDRN